MKAAHLHAQVSAQGFYAAAGFQPIGEVFDEVGIPHQAMTKTLTPTLKPAA
jgi:predicted GNAT family N-acyltransferase